MRYRANTASLLLGLLLIPTMLAVNCDDNTPITPEMVYPIIDDSAYVVDEDNLVLQSSEDGTYVYSYSGNAPDIQVGDVLVGEVDGGYLRHVLGVVDDDGVLTAETEQACLVDIIERGAVSDTFAVSPGRIVPLTPGVRHLGTRVNYISPALRIRDDAWNLDGEVLFSGDYQGVNLTATITEGVIDFDLIVLKYCNE